MLRLEYWSSYSYCVENYKEGCTGNYIINIEHIQNCKTMFVYIIMLIIHSSSCILVILDSKKLVYLQLFNKNFSVNTFSGTGPKATSNSFFRFKLMIRIIFITYNLLRITALKKLARTIIDYCICYTPGVFDLFRSHFDCCLKGICKLCITYLNYLKIFK